MSDASTTKHAVSNRLNHIFAMAEIEILFKAEKAAAAFSDKLGKRAQRRFAGGKKAHKLTSVARPITRIAVRVAHITRATELRRVTVFDSVIFEQRRQRVLRKTGLPADRQFADIDQHLDAALL